MATADSVKVKIQNLINKANTKTGESDADLTSAVDTLIEGYGKGEEATGTINITSNGTHDVKKYASASVNVPPTGITPSGTKEITSNGTHDVTNYASAKVNVPSSGITPTGTKEITANGTHDVTSFASALVNVPTGLNAQFYTVTLSADSTAATTFLTNDWLKSIRSNPNAFVFLRYLGATSAIACVGMVFSANFSLWYNGSTSALYKSVVLRQTASNAGYTGGTGGISATGQYNGNLMIDANGKLWGYGNASYPFKAGQYQIIAGTMEMM